MVAFSLRNEASSGSATAINMSEGAYQAGDLFILYAAVYDNTISGVSSSPGGSWTQVASDATGSNKLYYWIAQTGGSGFTVTTTQSGSLRAMYASLHRVVDYDPITPFGASGSGRGSHVDPGDLAAFTSTVGNSGLFVGVQNTGLYPGVSGPTSSDTTASTYNLTSGSYTFSGLSGYRPDVGVVGAKTVQVTSPYGPDIPSWNWAAVEVLPAPVTVVRQNTFVTSNALTTTLSLFGGWVTGETLVAMAGCAFGVQTVSDSVNGNWTLAVGSGDYGGYPTHAIYYKANAAGTSGNVTMMGGGGAGHRVLALYRVAGAGSTPLGATGTQFKASGGSTDITVSLTTQRPKSAVIAWASDYVSLINNLTSDSVATKATYAYGYGYGLGGCRVIGSTGSKSYTFTSPGTPELRALAAEFGIQPPTPISDTDSSTGADADSAPVDIPQKYGSESVRCNDQPKTMDKSSSLALTSVAGWNYISANAVTSDSFSVTAGDLLVVCAQSYIGITSITDSQGGTWTSVQNYGGYSGIYRRTISVTGSMTVSANSLGSWPVAVKVYKVTGHNASTPFGGNGGTESASSPFVPALFTSTSPSSIMLANVFQADLSNTAAPTSSDLAVSSWYSGSSHASGLSGTKTLGATGTQTATITLAGSVQFYATGTEIIPAAPASVTTFISDFDNGFSAEAGSNLEPKSDAETATGADAGSVYFEPTGEDESAGADAETLEALLTDADTASGVDEGLADADLSDGDTAPSVEEAWLTDRPVSSSDTVSSTEAVIARWVTSADTASATEATTDRTLGQDEAAIAAEIDAIFAAMSDADTATDDETEFPIPFFDADAASAAGADEVSFLDYSYKFNPPGIQGYRDPKHPLFRRIPHVVGVTVLKIGGTYRQIENPEDSDFAAATETYLGGHDTMVNQATADALTAAGYGAYLTRF